MNLEKVAIGFPSLNIIENALMRWQLCELEIW
jgi:hypothetical protein